MLRKKIRKLIISIILIAVIFFGGKYILNNKTPFFNVNNHKQVEYKMDMTQFKIKNILATNKFQSLVVNFSTELEVKSYDKSDIKILDKLSKLLTSRNLILEGEYNAIFSADLSKAIFTDNSDGTYTITINTDDIEVDVVNVDSKVTKDTMSLIGRYYNCKECMEIKNLLDDTAKNKINTNEYREKAKDNCIVDLQKLFKNVGIDTNKIIIE